MRQQLQGVADQQGQDDPSAGERQALKTRMDGDVLAQQLVGEGRQLRPQGQGALQVGIVERVSLDTDEVQPRTRGCLLLEQLPGAEKIQPGAEAGFAYRQLLAVAQGTETCRQIVIGEKHMAGFGQAVLLGEIDIAKQSR
ncbi:hypothetical protein D3C80_1368810 [compost metagenome]